MYVPLLILSLKSEEISNIVSKGDPFSLLIGEPNSHLKLKVRDLANKSVWKI